MRSTQLSQTPLRLTWGGKVSGRMAQRVLISGAVSCEPEIMVADDEPTTALDVTVQAEVLDLLRGLQEERGMTLLPRDAQLRRSGGLL